MVHLVSLGIDRQGEMVLAPIRQTITKAKALKRGQENGSWITWCVMGGNSK